MTDREEDVQTPTDRGRWAFARSNGTQSPRTAVRGRKTGRWTPGLALVIAAVCCAASGLDEFRVKREQVFEFAARPVVARRGDRVTITFETKGFCDVTVAVEDEKGRIVRHLASGVLGPNAPAPFQRNAKKQVIVWDGKDNQGAYVPDYDKVTVRVSLGLKPRYERTVHWSPQRKTGGIGNSPMLAMPEGVYVSDNSGEYTRIMLFNHDGDYRRTIYPFPADQVAHIDGIQWRVMPQTGLRYPLRNGLSQTTLLTTGDASFGTSWPTRGGGSPVLAMAVHGTRMYIVSRRINRIALDGAWKGLPLSGPLVFQQVYLPRQHAWPGGTVNVGPHAMALSPDGKYAYLAGFFYHRAWQENGFHGVFRMSTEGDAKPAIFVGSADPKQSGSADGAFNVAASVDVDARGRVYVADYGNNRIQVFNADGKHLRSIKHLRPALVRVDPKTGEIYVFTWKVPCQFDRMNAETYRRTVKRVLVRRGPFDDPAVLATCDLGIESPLLDGPSAQAAVDFWTDPPTIWLQQAATSAAWIEPNNTRTHTRLLVAKDGRLVVKRDFTNDIRRSTLYLKRVRKSRIKVFCNEADGTLYIGYGDSGVAKSFYKVLKVDPATGRHQLFQLPFDTEDMAFDQRGYAYLRTENLVARYDPSVVPWKEAPFDYGLARTGVGFGYEVGQGGKAGNVVAGIPVPSVKSASYWHMGGMYVSPRGSIAVTCYNENTRPTDRKTEIRIKPDPGTRMYQPVVFPGRDTRWAVHVFDQHGRKIYEDALPGSGQLSGIGMDRDDNLYAMMLGQRVIAGKPYFNDVSCTVFKARPRDTKFLRPGGTPIPLPAGRRPKRQPDVRGGPLGSAWIDSAEWLYGGVGTAAKFLGRCGGGCWCDGAQMTLDFYARSFIPENDMYSIAVLDSNGSLITRIGRYGNVDDGMPLSGRRSARSGQPDTRHPTPDTRSIGGDEVSLLTPRFLATHTDRRLFINDTGNYRVLSVKLDYHTTEKVALKDVPDGGG